jgi:hypothetical protein
MAKNVVLASMFASSRHTTKLDQSRFSLDVYGKKKVLLTLRTRTLSFANSKNLIFEEIFRNIRYIFVIYKSEAQSLSLKLALYL